MVRKTTAMRLIELEFGRPLEDLLRELYIEQELPAAEVASRLGVSKPTIFNWMRELGIPTRTLMLPPEATGRR